MEESIKYSIIIPCYNTLNTVLETLASVKEQEYSNWEAIIVNDGSPDNLEDLVLDYIKDDKRFKYFKKENGGLASARNFGIEKSTGDYILPLDSDNKVRPQFLQWATEILTKNNNISVLYGDAQRFGEVSSYWEVGAYNKYKLLKWNYIDACAIIKKSVFDTLGLYDSNMPHQGLEDWDLWLRCTENKLNFYYLKKITFDYRVTRDSMIKGFSDKMNEESKQYIITKFFNLYHESVCELNQQNNQLKRKVNKITRHPIYKFYKKLSS